MKRRTSLTVWPSVFAVLLVAVLAVPTPVLAQNAGAEPTEFDQGMEKLRLGEFASAATILERVAASEAATDTGVQALYFAGLARQSAGDTARAVAIYQRFLAAHADHALSDKVRFRCADCLIEMRRGQDAANLFAVAAHRLTAPERAREVAGRFLEMGDRLFDGVESPDPQIPGRTVIVHDYPTAVTMYRNALEIGLDDAAALKAKRRVADGLANAGNWRECVTAWRVLANDPGTPAEVRFDAQYGAAMAAIRANMLDEAAVQLAEIVSAGANHPRYTDALWERAQLFSRPGWDFNIARASAEAFIQVRPNDALAPWIRLWLAKLEFSNGQPAAAAERFARFIGLYGNDGGHADAVAEARIMRGHALTNARRFDEAIAAYREFLQKHANHASAAQARDAIRNVNLQYARTATETAAASPFDVAARQTAIDAWGNFIEQHPADGEVVNGLFSLANLMEAGEDFSGAIEMLRRVAAQFPRHSVRSTLEVARIYEQKLHEEERALEEYRRLANSHQGLEGISRLTSPELALSTAGVVTTDGAANVTVSSRNINELICRAYKLDLLEFFRRKRETGNVERLMVDVLRPDHSWTFAVPDFREYRKQQFTVNCPVEGAGAYVVTVANDKFRGCTLVITSDLQVIVKSSPTQIFVLAMNARTKAPWGGVDLLMFGGNNIAFEGVTGDDGIFVYDATTDKTGDGPAFDLRSVRLFAAANGNYAFHNFSPEQLAAFAYTPKGYAFTDRPLYRAGERVQFKAMVRDVRDGAYALPEAANAKYRAICTDGRGQQIWQRDLTLSDMGTCDGSLQLGDETGTGEYTLSFHSLTPRLPNFTATFHVRPFERPEFQITATFDRPLYAIRQGAKLSIAARRYTGSPLANQPVVVQIYTAVDRYVPSAGGVGASWFYEDRAEPRQITPTGGVKVFNVVTDDDGNAEIEFVPDLPSTPRGPQFIRVIADVRAQADTGAAVSAQAMAAVAGNSAFVQLVPRSENIRQGQEMPITARAETVLNTPANLTGTFRLYRGESLTEFNPRQALATTTGMFGENGRTEVTFRPDKPGTYTVHFEATGHWGEPITASVECRVVAPDDTERRDLVVMTDKDKYFAGETAQVTILTPALVPTALLTVEAEKVVFHKIIALDRREMKISLPVESAYLPNVRISVATIANGQLVVGETELAVRKLLNVKLTTDQTTFRPGDEVEVTIVATDQLGRPVRAEVALAVIDEAVFDLQADTAGDIRASFYNVVRQIPVTTGASVGWNYTGQVAAVDPDVLNDARTQMRLLAEKMEQQGQPARPGAAPPEALMDELRRGMEPNSAPANDAANEAFDGEGASGGMFARRARGGGGARADNAMQLTLEMPVRSDFRLTAAFAPSIRTDANGQATFRFKLPDTVATWRLTARGITVDTQVGEARHSVKTVMPFYGALDVPRVATEGDRFEIAAQFVNETTAEGQIQMALGEENAPPAKPVVQVVLDPAVCEKLGISPADVRTALRGAGVELAAGAFSLDPFEATILNAPNMADLPRLAVGSTRANNRQVPVLLSQVATLSRVMADANFNESTGAAAVGSGAVVRAMIHANRAGELKVAALGRMGDNFDALRRDIRVQPFGEPVRNGFSGQMNSDGRASANVVLPLGAMPEATQLMIHVTPSLTDSLLDSLDYLREYPYGCIEQTVNRFFPAIQVFAAFRDLEHKAPEAYAETKKIVETGLSRVVTMQNADGGWGWWGNGASNPQLSALCYDALMTAVRLDFPVPVAAVQKARAFLFNQIRPDGRPLSRAEAAVLQALATHSVDSNEMTPFNDSRTRSLVVRVLTASQGPTQRATADVAARFIIAANAVGLRDSVRAVVRNLESLAQIERGGDGKLRARWVAGADSFGYGGSDVETTALALQALTMSFTNIELQAAAVNWLEGQKHGKQWRATRDTAMVVQAYTAYMLANRARTAAVGDVKVMLNGKQVGTITLGDDRTKHTLKLTGFGDLQTGNNLVEFVADTDAAPRFTGLLQTVVASDAIESRSAEFTLERHYLAGPTRHSVDGAELFEVSTGPSRPQPIDVAGHGDLIQVMLTITTDQDRDEVMLEDPLPAGCEPISKEVAGANRFEHREGKVVMFFDRLTRGTRTVSYTVRAVRPGQFRVLPPVVSMMYFPEIWARGAHARLRVLTAEMQAARLAQTPAARAGQLMADFRDALAENRADDAMALGASLLEFQNLRANVRGDVCRHLLRIAFDRRDLAMIRAQLDALTHIGMGPGAMDVATVMLAGDAYREVRPAQAMSYYRNALSAMYDLERRAADLAIDGDTKVKELARVLDRFPDSHTLFQHRSDWATQAANAAPAAERESVYRAALLRLASESPVGYWNRYAMYKVGARLVEIGKYAEARAFAERWLPRLDPKLEPLADNVMFLAAFSAFAELDIATAKDYANRLVNGEFIDDGNAQNPNAASFYYIDPSSLAQMVRRGQVRIRPSEMRQTGALMLAQIAHAEGDLATAVRWYREAAPRFEDARVALKELTSVEFEVPAFVRVNAGSDAVMPVTGRNVADVAVDVYPFDLLYCFTVRKHLRDLNTIDLTGLTPEQTQEITLDVPAHERVESAINLGQLKTGAYLVLVKAGDRVQSSIVLVTSLTVEARREGQSVRVTVTDANGRPVGGAYVKVSDGARIVATGRTDLRGIFTAPSGNAVLVERNGEYALVPEVK